MSHEYHECRVDAREMEAPKPLQETLAVARTLRADEYIKMIHRMKPCKLEAALSNLDLESLYFEIDDTHYIYSWHRENTELKTYIKERISHEYGRIIA